LENISSWQERTLKKKEEDWQLSARESSEHDFQLNPPRVLRDEVSGVANAEGKPE
jgi:hypothetical protein